MAEHCLTQFPTYNLMLKYYVQRLLSTQTAGLSLQILITVAM